MKTSLTFTIGPEAASNPAESTRSKRAHAHNSLASVAIGDSVSVRAVRLEAAEAEWLRAMGIFEGQRVTLLRRALFGGPLHVRTVSGGEFAVDRSLADQIDVEPATRERD
jgi:ferrous iron transport protein A